MKIMEILTLSMISTLGCNALYASSSYELSKDLLKNAPSEILTVMNNAPKTYEFKSQFDQKDSVDYTGQTFRQILIEELKSFMSVQKRGNYPGTKEEARDAMMSFLDFNPKNQSTAEGSINGSSLFTMKAYFLDKTEAPITEGFVFDDIQSPGKKLLDKLAGNDNPLRRGVLKGWDSNLKTPQELLLSFVDELAINASEGSTFTVPNGNLPVQRIDTADTTPEGRNLTELTQKFLQGAVSYSQAAEDYLSTNLGPKKGLNVDNELRYEPSANHTALEHFFDEAYGYFGGARDVSLYKDAEQSGGVSKDSNNDGSISLLKEKNHGLAKNFSRVDLAIKDQSLDLSKEVSEAFLKGRHLITMKPANFRPYVIAQAQVALGAWEKTIGIVSAIYLGHMIKSYEAYGTENYSFKNLAKFFSEMKGFSLSLQFNPSAIMSDATFDQFHSLVGNSPALPHGNAQDVQTYVANLKLARELILKTYGLDSTKL